MITLTDRTFRREEASSKVLLMKYMYINLYYCGIDDKGMERNIKKAVDSINWCQREYFIQYSNITDCKKNHIQQIQTYINHNPILDFNKMFHIYESNQSEEYTIIIVNKPFTFNEGEADWFSHEERNFSSITVYDWESVYSPPPASTYIKYMIVEALISFSGDISEQMQAKMLHEETKGCVFDLCEKKEDLILGMISGIICPECKERLKKYGLNEKVFLALSKILEDIRLEAIGEPKDIDEAAFIAMHYSENDENDHAYQYGILPALKLLGIHPNRADNTLSSDQILDKVRTYVTRSHFIIAKVDVENLNTYFELGLAMGEKKDVLLICEHGHIPKLPTDLKNWECLTYTKGNYEELMVKIVQYYTTNYKYIEMRRRNNND